MSKLHLDTRGCGSFLCPGCGEVHTVRLNSVDAGRDWAFNGNTERPTLSPSVLTRSGHHVPGHTGHSCWCTYNKQHPEKLKPFECRICHSYVTDGRIQFLSDCSHALAGQTVDLPDFPA